MGKINTSISVQDNISPAFQTINTVANATINTFEKFDNVIANTPTINNSNEVALNSMSKGVENTSNAIQQLNNDMNSIPNTDYWTSKVGHYNKSMLEAVYTTEELVQQGFKTTDALKSQERPIEQINTKVAELKSNVSNWNSSPNIELFNSGGIERYQQEMQSANSMINRLAQSQNQIQNQANSIKLLPNNAINDLNNLNNRITTLQGKIQAIQNKKITTLGAEKANKQIEELREKLNKALQAQNNLNNAMHNMNIKEANEAYLNLENTIRDTERYINNNTNDQRNFNNELKNGNTTASKLGSTIKNLATAYLGIQGIRKGFNFVKESVGLANIQNASETQLRAVLNNVSATEGAYDQLYSKASEIQSRGIYGDEAMLGGAAEIATYISDPKAIESMMDTLSNYAVGMSGGGAVDKTNMVNYATQLGKALDGTYDGLTKKGFTLTDSQKKIIETGNDMQKALVLDEVISQSWENLYETMSNTPESQIIRLQNAWGDSKEVVGNGLYPAILKMFNTINKNMPIIQKFVNGFTTGMYYIIEAITFGIDVACKFGNFVSDNWSIIGPIIFGIVGALVLYKGALIALSIAQGISAFAHKVKAAAATADAIATAGATGAQWGLNAALLACPITWVIGILLVLITVFIALWDNCEGFRNFFTDMLMEQEKGLARLYNNFIVPVINGFIDALNFVNEAQHSFWTSSINGFANMAINIIESFSGIVNILKTMISAYNKVSGAFGGITIDTNILSTDGINAIRNKALGAVEGLYGGKFEHLKSINLETWDASADALGNKMKDFRFSDVFNNLKDKLPNYEMDALNNKMLNDISNNTGSIADTIDITNEDLKYLRDLAEQEVVNRFTTAEIKIDMTNNNNINNEMDIDGIVDYLANGVNDAMEIAAEGMHN